LRVGVGTVLLMRTQVWSGSTAECRKDLAAHQTGGAEHTAEVDVAACHQSEPMCARHACKHATHLSAWHLSSRCLDAGSHLGRRRRPDPEQRVRPSRAGGGVGGHVGGLVAAGPDREDEPAGFGGVPGFEEGHAGDGSPLCGRRTARTTVSPKAASTASSATVPDMRSIASGGVAASATPPPAVGRPRRRWRRR
jgi:hypothetical protein